MDWLFTYTDPDLDWNYAMITLVVRFIGVFVVMLVMQIALQASARAVGWIERRQEAGKSPAPAAAAKTALEAKPAEASPVDDAALVAIALALEAESRPVAGHLEAGPSSSWATAGRLHRLSRFQP